ncbi:MAG: TlpA family protein disulfide reductase [Pseudomonadota bacterium]|nr:MAG: TlpA family protein disulfide reductase [Pseudomonadota bacterium]
MKARAILLAVVIVLPAIGAPQARETGHRVGQSAPDFALKDLEGRIHSLAQLRKDGPVLLIFWATECVYCHAMLSDFKAAHAEYAGRGLTLAGINIGGEHNVEVKAYVTDNAVPWLILSDRVANLDVAEAYRVLGTPTVVLVASDGEVLFYGHRMPDLKKLVGSS